MIREHEMVALEVDLPEHSLRRGDVGTVVQVFPEDSAYLVEFNTVDGEPVAMIEVSSAQVHLVAPGKRRVTRELAA